MVLSAGWFPAGRAIELAERQESPRRNSKNKTARRFGGHSITLRTRLIGLFVGKHDEIPKRLPSYRDALGRANAPAGPLARLRRRL
jgi:hypothetical protein